MSSKRTQTAVMLIDALGWEIARHFNFCEGALARRTSLGTVLGYSSAAIPSLLSGTLPEAHGCWSMWRLATGRRPFGYLRWLPPLPHALEWRTRRFVRRWTDRRGVIGGYYDLYDIPLSVLARLDVAREGDPYVPGGLGKETVFDWMVQHGVPYRLWNYRTDEAENMAGFVDAVGGDADVLFFYTAELDALMHRAGVVDNSVRDRLARYERLIERAFDAATREDVDLQFVLLSDHGMTPVTRTVDVWRLLREAGFAPGKNTPMFVDSTMARFWKCDDAAHALGGTLRRMNAGRMLDADDLARYGCRFPGAEYGDAVVLANPGVLFVPSFMGREPVAAMHGYDPEDSHSLGVFMTNIEGVPTPTSILGFHEFLTSHLATRR